MDKETKKIFIGVLVPILFIVGVVIFSQFPMKNKQEPAYDFLYFIDRSDYGSYKSREETNKKFSLDAGKFITYDDSVINQIRLYDVSEGSYRRLNKEELESMEIETQSVSPDGFSIEFGTRTDVDMFLFPVASSRTDYSKLYLEKDGSSVKLNLGGNGYYYNNRDMFIGWVIPNEQ